MALVFLGIVVYVFMGKKEDFEEAARIPLEEDHPIKEQDKEDKHG